MRPLLPLLTLTLGTCGTASSSLAQSKYVPGSTWGGSVSGALSSFDGVDASSLGLGLTVLGRLDVGFSLGDVTMEDRSGDAMNARYVAPYLTFMTKEPVPGDPTTLHVAVLYHLRQDPTAHHRRFVHHGLSVGVALARDLVPTGVLYVGPEVDVAYSYLIDDGVRSTFTAGLALGLALTLGPGVTFVVEPGVVLNTDTRELGRAVSFGLIVHR